LTRESNDGVCEHSVILWKEVDVLDTIYSQGCSISQTLDTILMMDEVANL